MKFSTVICGVGGQGVVLLSSLITQSAFDQGYNVKSSTIKGFSVRGGTVLSYVRFGDEPIYSPVPPLGSTNLLLAFEPLEALRQLHYLSNNGVAVVNLVPIPTRGYTTLENLGKKFNHHNTIFVNANAIAEEVGSPHVQNIALLGAASNHLPIKNEILKENVKKMCPMPELNLNAFEKGAKVIYKVFYPHEEKVKIPPGE